MVTTPSETRSTLTSALPAVSEIRRVHAQHRSIARQVSALMHLLDAQPPDGAPDRRADVVRRIRRLQRDLARHFEDEEKVGFLRHAVDLAPRLSRRAHAIVSQHAWLRIALEEVASLGARRDGACVEMRSAFQAFSASLERHEDHENELIDEAFLEDLGGG